MHEEDKSKGSTFPPLNTPAKFPSKYSVELTEKKSTPSRELHVT